MHAFFAGPKADFVFKRIFGAEARKPLLIALLNHLLELKGDRRILDVQHPSGDQHVDVAELKLSIVDVKCTDASGRRCMLPTMGGSTTLASADEPLVVPRDLPFLESLSWFDASWRELSALEMLQRYESGWRHRGVTADLSAEELAFVRALVERFGSVIDVPA